MAQRMLRQQADYPGMHAVLLVVVASHFLAGVQGATHATELLRSSFHDQKAVQALASEKIDARSTHAYQAAKVAGLRASAQRRTDQSSHVARTTGATEASLAAQLHAAETRAATVATANSALMAEVKVAQQNAAQASLQNGLLAKKLEAASHNAAESALALAAVQKRMEAEKASALNKLQSATDAKLKSEEGKERALAAKVEALQTAAEKASSQIASWQKSSQAEAVATRHDRLGLLSEISELQEDLQNSRHQEELSRSSLAELQKQTKQKLQEEETAVKMRDQHELEQVKSLQAELRAVRSNLTVEMSQNRKLQEQGSQEISMLTDAKSRLLAAVSEDNDLQAAKDSALTAEALASKKASAAAEALQEAQRKLHHDMLSVQAMKSELNATKVKEATMETARAQLQAQLVDLQKSSTASEAAKDKQMHETILAAAAKVRDYQDRAENLQGQLQAKQQELEKTSDALAQQQDDVLKAREAVREANQQVASLLASSSKVAKIANNSAAHESQLQHQIVTLQEDHVNLVSKVSYLQQHNQQTSVEVDALRAKAEEMRKAAASAKAENKDLHEKLATLQAVAQNTRALESDLQQAQAEARLNASRAQSMQAEIDRLRQLEEHDSSDDDGLRKEVQNERDHAAALESQLRAKQSNEQAAAHQRDEALEQIKAMGGQEDEYFQENTQLRQQNEDVLAKYQESETARNRSRAEVQELKGKIEEMQAEDVRREDHFNRAVVAAQAAAASIKKSFLATKADLLKTQQELQDILAQKLLQNQTNSSKHQELKQVVAKGRHQKQAHRSTPALSAGHKPGQVSAVPEQGSALEEIKHHVGSKPLLQHHELHAVAPPVAGGSQILSSHASSAAAGNHQQDRAGVAKALRANSTGLVQVKVQPFGVPSSGKAARNPLKELMALFTSN